MMKWKVVKNPRSASVDRSLECLSNDNQQPNSNGTEEDTSPPVKEKGKQRDSSLVRKTTAALASECINLRSILGLTRQRSETNLSHLGLVSAEPRRSRSEVRGVSCDRLAFGYHTTPAKPIENGKTRSSSPPTKSGCWLRGRKRERDSRKNNSTDPGKTIVTGSCSKRTGSKTRNGDGRTIVDASESKMFPSKSSPGKAAKRTGEEDIIEEEVIYSEITQDNVCGKLLAENKVPTKVIRKKGQAPKPQVTTELFRDSNVVPSTLKTNGSLISLKEPSQTPTNRKQHRKNQTFNGRNQERRTENRAMHSVKMNNLKNNEKARRKTNILTSVQVAEVHKETTPLIPGSEPGPKDIHAEEGKKDTKPFSGEKESQPFHIDTPDYSTLDSVNCTTADTMKYGSECDENIPLIASDNVAESEIVISSILRDSSNDCKETDLDSKKSVRFEKFDLIEKYKRNKTEYLMDTENDAEISANESDPVVNSDLEADTTEILPFNAEDTLEYDHPLRNLTLNLLVSSPTPSPQTPTSSPNEEPSPQFVVKKSFVLTVAKQEKGFKSLCANRKTEAAAAREQQFSVTFLCSGPTSEGWMSSAAEDGQRLRSTSVPPLSLQASEMTQPAIRGRSRERRSKERQHCRKNHKGRKKDAVFVMPQAVIDELSQVLEKRKPSLDEIPVHP